MRDVGLMTEQELAKELDAFYSFVQMFGHGYLTEEGRLHFNHIRAEYVRRVKEKRVSRQVEV
jgi:hypothetical protein